MSNIYVYSDQSWSKEDPKEIAAKEIAENAHVLDVGCGVGGLGKWLKQNKHATVDGLEFNQLAVKKAQKVLDSARVIDLNDIKALNNVLKGSTYDVITVIDVLEHCLYPDKILTVLTSHLTKDGFLIISLPNIAYYTIRFELLFGRFDYHDSGIMDKTHVHMYTKKSMEALFDSAGLNSELLGSTVPSGRIKKLLAKLAPNALSVQFVYKVSK